MIALVSSTGDSAGIGVHLTRQGTDVQWSPKDDDCMPMLRGIVARHAKFPAIGKADLVMCDALGFTPWAKYQRKSTPVIGGNNLEDWEKHRQLGLKVIEHGGLKVSRTEEFATLPEAERFLKRNPGEWYFKPDGEVPKSMTRKADSDMMLRFLRYAAPQLTKAKRFILQAPAPKGVEIDVCCWLDGEAPIAYEVTIEEKKFMHGNHGPALGCASNVVWEIPATSKLVRLTIGPFIDHLIAAGYVGVAAINTIITPDLEVYGLEWTMRLGFDSTQASFALFDSTLGDQLVDFAQGNLARFYRSAHAGMTIRLGLPPQPYEDSKDARKSMGLPLPAAALDDPAIWPDDIARTPAGPVMPTGSGYLGVAVTTGTDLPHMRKALVEVAESLDVPDLMFRDDPVSRLDEALTFLTDHHLCETPFVKPRKSDSVAA